MAIRFCKGEKDKFNLNDAIIFNNDVFKNAHNKFLNSTIEYIPLIDSNNKYICCCYDDKNIDNLFNKIYLLFNSDYSLKKIKNIYKRSTIISLNEISYYLYVMLKKNNCQVYAYGELWDYLNINTCNEIKGTGIFSEGNVGLTLNELGYYKMTFPFNEFKFFEDLSYRTSKNNKLYNNKILSKKKANKELSKKIISGKPFMAARLGNTESIITNQNSNYYTKFWLKYLYTTSGFFSKKNFTNDIEKLFVKNDVDLYAQKMIKCVKNCDFHLCCFSNEIPLLNKYSDKKSLNFDWYDLYTNFDSNSWLKALECKKVLIISSFNKSIKYQLKNIKKVFPFFDFPNLNIVYYDFPLTFMGNYNSKENFFELYTFVFNEIKKIDFDIALIAAGAYGYMLASDIKDAGKQTIELCSGLYPVFGIKNKTQSIIRKVSAMYNENWIFPIEAKPEKYMDIEKGAYWE